MSGGAVFPPQKARVPPSTTEGSSNPDAARLKLIAACHAYTGNWPRLFRRLDADCLGSLSQQQMLAGLRRLIRIHPSQVTDAEINQVYMGARGSETALLTSDAFARFMNGETADQPKHPTYSESPAVATPPESSQLGDDDDDAPVQMRSHRNAMQYGVLANRGRSRVRKPRGRSSSPLKARGGRPSMPTVVTDIPDADDDLDYAPVVASPMRSPGRKSPRTPRRRGVLI